MEIDDKQNIVLNGNSFDSGDHVDKIPTIISEDTLDEVLLLLQKHKIYKSLKFVPIEPAEGSVVHSYTFYFDDGTSISIFLEDGSFVKIPTNILAFSEAFDEFIKTIG